MAVVAVHDARTAAQPCHHSSSKLVIAEGTLQLNSQLHYSQRTVSAMESNVAVVLWRCDTGLIMANLRRMTKAGFTTPWQAARSLLLPALICSQINSTDASGVSRSKSHGQKAGKGAMNYLSTVFQLLVSTRYTMKRREMKRGVSSTLQASLQFLISDFIALPEVVPTPPAR